MAQPTTTARVSVSTWALHPLLGKTFPGRPGDPDALFMSSKAGTLDLLDAPAELAKRGITTMELCHFHLPADPTYREEFRSAVNEAGVELWNVLIDDGDLTHPEHGERDAAWVLGWLETAGKLGASNVRVIAGKQSPVSANIDIARKRLRALAAAGARHNVGVMTENWYDLLSGPEPMHELLADTNGTIGLCFDFGNWASRSDKYDALAKIAPYANSSHAKCNFDASGVMDETDYRRCCDLLAAVDYSGPYTLVASDPNDTWGGIERQRDFLQSGGYTFSGQN